MSEENQERALVLVREAGELHQTCIGNDQRGFDVSQVLSPNGPTPLAIAKYSEALELWPDCVIALVMRCSSRLLMRDREGAQSDAKRALELTSEPQFMSMLARAFDGEEARDVLKIGMKQCPEDTLEYACLWGELAQTYAEVGDYAAQARELEGLCAMNLETDLRRDFFEALGEAYQSLGELRKANLCYEKALPESLPSLIALQMEMGCTDRTLVTIETYREHLFPEEALIATAVTRALAGRKVHNIELAMKAIYEQAKSRAYGLDAFSAGVLFKSLGDNELAQTYLTRCMEQVAADPQSWHPSVRWHARKAEELLDQLAD